MELNDCGLPAGVEIFKFFLVWGDNFLVEAIKGSMFHEVAVLILNFVLNEKLIDLRLQQEGNIDEIFSELI